MRFIRHLWARRAGAVVLVAAMLAGGPAPVAAAPSDHVVYVNNRSKRIIKCYRILDGRALPVQTVQAGGNLKYTAPVVVIACPGIRHAAPERGGALLNAGHYFWLSQAPDGAIELNTVGLNA